MKRSFLLLTLLTLISLLAGCSQINLQKALVTLTQPTGTVKGLVLDSSSGEPVPFVTVQVIVGESPNNSSQTLEDGSFTILDVPAGSHQLQISQPTARRTEKKYPPATLPVVVERNRQSYIEAKITEADRLPIRGYLLDSKNQPIQGVEISLADSYINGPYVETVTDGTGFFKANIYEGEHTLTYRKYYALDQLFTGNIEFNFPEENDLEIYRWIGPFDQGLGYHPTSKSLTLTWPRFQMDREVHYEIVLSRNLQGYRLPIRSNTTTGQATTFELTLNTEYGIDFYAYDVATGQLLDQHSGQLYWVDLPVETPVDEVEVFLNHFQRLFNNQASSSIAKLISPEYMDSLGRTKDEVTTVLESYIQERQLLALYNFEILPIIDDQNQLTQASVTMEYWLGTQEENSKNSIVAFTISSINGELMIDHAEFAVPQELP